MRARFTIAHANQHSNLRMKLSANFVRPSHCILVNVSHSLASVRQIPSSSLGIQARRVGDCQQAPTYHPIPLREARDVTPARKKAERVVLPSHLKLRCSARQVGAGS